MKTEDKKKIVSELLAQLEQKDLSKQEQRKVLAAAYGQSIKNHKAELQN